MTKAIRWTPEQLATHRRKQSLGQFNRERTALQPKPPFVAPARPVVPRGKMNKTEAAYDHLLSLRQRAGEITWYKFEGIKLRLANRTFLTIDFPLRLADGSIEMHEVKGFMEDDAAVKLKVAAEMFPFFRFVVVRKLRLRDGGGFVLKDVADGL